MPKSSSIWKKTRLRNNKLPFWENKTAFCLNKTPFYFDESPFYFEKTAFWSIEMASFPAECAYQMLQVCLYSLDVGRQRVVVWSCFAVKGKPQKMSAAVGDIELIW